MSWAPDGDLCAFIFAGESGVGLECATTTAAGDLRGRELSPPPTRPRTHIHACRHLPAIVAGWLGADGSVVICSCSSWARWPAACSSRRAPTTSSSSTAAAAGPACVPYALSPNLYPGRGDPSSHPAPGGLHCVTQIPETAPHGTPRRGDCRRSSQSLGWSTGEERSPGCQDGDLGTRGTRYEKGAGVLQICVPLAVEARPAASGDGGAAERGPKQECAAP